MKMLNAKCGMLKMLCITIGICLAMGGCAGLPAMPTVAQQRAQARTIADTLAAANQGVADLKAQVAQIKTQAAAATQPVVIAPATVSAGGVITPATTLPAPEAAVKAAETITKGAEAAETQLSKAEALLAAYQANANQYQQQLASSQTQQQQLQAALQALAKTTSDTAHIVAPQYAGTIDAYIAIGSLLSGMIIGLAGVIKGHQTAAVAMQTPGTTFAPGPATPA
jgi:hypothetical protein